MHRLWLCCIIRDRVNPLSTRRAITITSGQLNLNEQRPLDGCEFESEFHRSRAYDAPTKKELHIVFGQFVQLILILTDVIPLNSHLSNYSRNLGSSAPKLARKVDRCAAKLGHWHQNASLSSKVFSSDNSADAQMIYERDPVYLHEAFVRIIYQYVFYVIELIPYLTSISATRITLKHHQILYTVACPSANDVASSLAYRDMYSLIYELQDASAETVLTVESLMKQNLTHLLPISA